MAYAMISLRSDGLGVNGGTCAPIDTTGADLLVLAAVYYSLSAAPTVSDSKSNTWTTSPSPLTAYDVGAPVDCTVQMFFCKPSSVGSGHTFTLTGTACYASVHVGAFSGSHASPYTSQESGSVGQATTRSPGSLTPSEDNCLVVAGFVMGQVSVPYPWNISGVDSFLSTDYVASSYFGGSIAYKIQTTATAIDPTWSWDGSLVYAGANMAVFKAAASGGSPWYYYAQQ